MILNILLLIIGIILFFVFTKKIKSSRQWQATATPLASIMGSGFLVSAPLLGGAVGAYAALSMICLLTLAYSIGSAVRFNIINFEPIEDDKGLAQKVAFISRVVLAGAYFISVTYYIQLLSAFVLNFFDVQSPITANYIATILLSLIGITGIIKGLGALEKIEKYAVSLNLGMIAALLFALLAHNAQHIYIGTWKISQTTPTLTFTNFRIILGLLIVVQGFETSRYLGDSYSKEERVSSMKRAQVISSIIYILFISLSTVLFHNDLGVDVTAIISMVKPISILLPILLSVAAIVSQFSAAVADTAGANGLVREITHQRISTQLAYAIILVISIFLTWETDVNQIISYASRAFALFYTLQCLVAILTAIKLKTKNKNLTMIKFSITLILSLSVFLLGLPSE